MVKELTDDEKRDVASAQPQNLLHNFSADRNKINGISLPGKRYSIEEYAVEELKSMIVHRGSIMIGKDGKSLRISQFLLQIKAHMNIEK